MQRPCYFLALVLMGFTILPTRGAIVYQNSEGASWIDYGPYERGQTVILAGTQRVITRFSFTYISRLNPATAVKARVRFYENNTNRWETETGGPDRLLYESSPIALSPQDVEAEATVSLDLTELDLRVPDNFTLSIEFTGVASDEVVGLKVLDQAEIGGNEELGEDWGFIWVNYDNVEGSALEGWAQGILKGFYAISIEAEGSDDPPTDPTRPLNDDFINALALGATAETNAVNLIGAGIEPLEPFPGTNVTRSIWYKWQSAVGGEFEASVAPANGTSVALFEGSALGNLTRVPFGIPYYQIKPNVSYYLRIAALPTIDAVELSHTFRESTIPSSEVRPPNDNFADAILLNELNPTGIAALSNATIEAGEPRAYPQAAGKTIWYRWTSPITGKASVRASSTNHASSNSILKAVYKGTSLTDLEQLPSPFLVDAGETYYIQFDTLNDPLEFELGVYAVEDTAPANDSFANTRHLAENSWYETIFLTHATREPAEPVQQAGDFKSVWWSWQAPYSGRASVLVNSAFITNVTISAFAGSELDRLTLLTSGQNTLAYKVQGGEIYRVAVSVPAHAVGDIEFRVYSYPEGYHDPIPGNHVLNPSFEEGPNGMDHWSTSIPSGSFEHLHGPAAHGKGWVVVPGSNTRIRQDIQTVPGARYEVSFAVKRGLGTTEPVEVKLKWDEQIVAVASFPRHEGLNWLRHKTTVLATNKLSRLEFENAGIATALDSVAVVWAEEAPAISKQPVSLSTPSGGAASLSLAATGTEPLRFQWYFGDSAIPGADRKVLVLTNLVSGRSGSYFAVVSNDFGAVTSRVATLQVDDYTSPVILVQPAGFRALAGSYSALSVLAAGAGPLRYQWYLDGSALEGLSNSHLVLSAFSSSGYYQVKISGDHGSVLSLPAYVTITEPETSNTPLLIDAPNYGSVYDADNITALKSEFVSQVYAGRSEFSLSPVSEPIPFRDGETAGAVPGPLNILLPEISQFEPAFAQLRAWEKAKGATFEHARAAGGRFGASKIVPIRNDGTLTTFVTPTFSLTAGLPGFTTGKLRPIQILPGAEVQWSFEGAPGFRYLIEKCANDFFWEPAMILTNATGVITFTTEMDARGEFYRSRILD